MSRPHTPVVAAAICLSVLLSATAQASPEAWERIDHPTFAGGETRVYINGIVPATRSAPWLAVGHLVQPDGTRVPTVWRSADGRRWSREQAAPSNGQPGRDRLFHPARSGNVAVAFGLTARGGEFETPAVWRSVGAAPFELVQEADAVFRVGETQVESVDEAGGGFVAVGARLRSDGAETTGVWRSPDGIDWTPEEDPRLVAASGDLNRAWASASRGSTLVVAGTVVHTSAAGADGALWTYRPGTGWTAAAGAGLAGPGLQEVGDVAVHRGRFVAVGPSTFAGATRPTAWVSSDGLRWKRVRMSQLGYEGTALKLAVAGGRIYAAGVLGPWVFLWSSADGEHWRGERLPDRVYRFRDVELPVLLAASGSRRLLSVRLPRRSSVWFGTGSNWQDVMAGSDAFPPPRTEFSISALADNGRTFVAFANPVLVEAGLLERKWNARAWHSTDARAWTQLPVRVFRDARVTDVTVVGSTFVAVGAAYRSGKPRAVAWHSDNGVDWFEVAVHKGPAPSELAGVAFDGKRLLALATEFHTGSNDVTLWSSPDGRAWRRERRLERGAVGAGDLCADSGQAVAIVIKARSTRTFDTIVWQREGAKPWHSRPRIPDLIVEDCAVKGPLVAAVGQFHGNADVLFQLRPGAWGQRPGAGDLGFTAPSRQLHAVTATADGFVAVGGDVGGGQHDIGIWTSSDAFTWTLVRGPASVFREPGVQQGTAVVVRGGQFVVGGVHGTGAAIWTGPR